MPASLCHALGEYIDVLLDAVCAVDRDGHFQFLSSGAERIFGYPVSEMLGRSMLDFIHPDDISKTLAAAQAINTGQIKTDFENRYLRKDGQIVHLLWSARWSADKQQRVAVARDITGLKLAESRQHALYAISEAAFAAEDLQDLYRQLLQIVQQLIPIQACVIARRTGDGGINLAYQYLSPDERLNAVEATDLCHLILQDTESGALPLLRERADYSLWLGVQLISHTSILGAMVILVSAQTAASHHADADLLGFVAQHMAVAIERKELLERLQHSALYDELTGLPKRELFYDRCRQAMAQAQRHQCQLAICYLDLDGFKPVNDQFGHGVGDDLLQQVAQRLIQNVRQADTVARFGGDEFVILLSEVDSAEQAVVAAEKIRHSFNTAFQLPSQNLTITASIGVVCAATTLNIESLLAIADQAMYRAKQLGGNRCIQG